MAGLRQPPAACTAVVDAPRRTSSEARPRRPECMSRATAERHRLSASYVQGAALEEGRTVYLRDGATATATGPTYTWNGTTMVRTTKFEPDHAADLLERAERKWATANREPHPVDKCEYLQRSIEYALKALITAGGRRVRHLHSLDGMWREAEATGDTVAATRDPKQSGETEPVRRAVALRQTAGRRGPGDNVAAEPDHRRGRPQPRPPARAATARADTRGAREPNPRRHRRRNAAGSGNAARPGTGNSREPKPPELIDGTPSSTRRWRRTTALRLRRIGRLDPRGARPRPWGPASNGAPPESFTKSTWDAIRSDEMAETGLPKP